MGYSTVSRTKADGYTPPAFWDQLRPIREALKINVIANGEDLEQCRCQTMPIRIGL